MKHAVAKIEDPIFDVIQRITDAPAQGGMPSIAVIVDENNLVLGVVTDGDIRKAVCKRVDFNQPVSSIMSKDPVCVEEDLSTEEFIKSAYKKMEDRSSSTGRQINNKVIKISKENKFIDIVNLHLLYRQEDVSQRLIAVYGLGFVGLTLALTLAENKLFEVVGIDVDKNKLEKLKDGVVPFYEVGLPSLLSQVLNEGNFNLSNDSQATQADVHIVSVGTPIDDNGKPIVKFIDDVCNSIGKILKKGDLVICRSTVPVGTTRKHIIPILEKQSNLKAGTDFHVSFAPERTVAGNALKELRVLPQVIGGYTPRCAKLCSSIFEKITKTIVNVDCLESAEVVKLINNTYRDLVFAFSNEVSYLCDRYNLDAFNVIQAANEGYPRNPIPTPSPGVGGTCLSKDPHLYGCHNNQNEFKEICLGNASREINKKGVDYVCWQFNKFLKRMHLKAKDLPILVMGLAFKGLPETSDYRNSPGVDLIQELKKMGCHVSVYDAVLKKSDMAEFGKVYDEASAALKGHKAVFFMNNHPYNTKFELYSGLKSLAAPALVFDGFGLINKNEVQSIDGITYSTMGFMSQ
ncbi:hypothetical protein BVY03_03345 [bacterium K02(2017)]|nr:hypothetical protein BVY03_03345 [bacterium K02(2017)]